jgi:hypothetical protein
MNSIVWRRVCISMQFEKLGLCEHVCSSRAGDTREGPDVYVFEGESFNRHVCLRHRI